MKVFQLALGLTLFGFILASITSSILNDSGLAMNKGQLKPLVLAMVGGKMKPPILVMI
ncbi:MAG: hypothetical protein ACJA13_002805 [Paraglaciecola sp.]|jgi:hypothetical protein